MHKYMSSHSFPAGQLTQDQLNRFAEAAQHDPDVRGYRSFTSLSEGKVFCVMEAESKDVIRAWFRKVGIPCETLSEVEWEGDRGLIRAA